MPDPLRCRHIHIEGRQCGSPALRNEKLCYQHHAARRPFARRPGDPVGPLLPDPEDLPAVQRGLAELLRLVARELIDDKQAKLLFALLTEAGTNLARIDRARARHRTLDLRAQTLALAEARFAAEHPESGSFGCHSRTQSASVVAEAYVVDLVNDPELGAIAPASDSHPAPKPAPQPKAQLAPQPEAQPDSKLNSSPKPHPETPDLLPAFARDSPADDNLRNRRAHAEAEAAAIAEANFQRLEEERREERRTLRKAAEDVYRARGIFPKHWLNPNPEEPDVPAASKPGTPEVSAPILSS